jgi:hypothetical protein
MEAVSFYETLGNFYLSTWFDIPEYSIRHSYYLQKLKSDIFKNEIFGKICIWCRYRLRLTPWLQWQNVGTINFRLTVALVRRTVTPILFWYLPQKITYLLTYGAELFLRSCQLCSYSRTSQHFMEPEGSFPCWQNPPLVQILSQIDTDQPSPFKLIRFWGIISKFVFRYLVLM